MTPEAQRLAEAVAWLKSGEAMMGPRTEAAVSVVLDQLASMIPAGGPAEEARWRPIETAPKDLAARLYRVRGVCVQGFVDATGKLCVNSDSKPWRRMVGKPTHWTLLPALPTPPCRGTACGTTTGEHSAECVAEHLKGLFREGGRP